MLAKCTIFALDDDQVVLEAVSGALSSLGNVESSALWSELTTGLFRCARTGTPSLLVCDLDMPGIGGMDFCRIVRRHCPRTKIVIFTADPRRAPRDLCDSVVNKRDGVPALAATARKLVALALATKDAQDPQ